VGFNDRGQGCVRARICFFIVDNLFQNHEIIKLALDYPVLSPLVIYCSLLLLALYPRKKSENPSFLSRPVTVELRGLAILLVIVGHIGVHILIPEQQGHFPVLGQYGVSIFFLLSGYGLTRSYFARPLMAGEFIRRRLSRVMIPYWIVTAIIVTLDTVVLDKSYTLTDLAATLLGFNGSLVVRSIDYVRWYITVLLIWYFLFMLIWKTMRGRKRKALCCFGIGSILIICDYYIYSIGYAYLSFPFGVVIGLYYDELYNLYKAIPKNRLLLGAGAVILANWLFRSFLLEYIDVFMPTIGMAFIAELSWLLVASSLAVIGSVLIPFYSPFLHIIGKYSYGIFLLHGALMIKYDFFLFRGYLFLTFWLSFILVVFSSIITEAFVFKKVHRLDLLH